MSRVKMSEIYCPVTWEWSYPDSLCEASFCVGRMKSRVEWGWGMGESMDPGVG